MTEKESLSLSMRELMPLVIEELERGGSVTLTVKGVSMQPYLMNGRDSIVMVAPDGRKPRVGDMYMFRRADGSYAMHRIYAVNPDGSLDFVGDNQFRVEKGIRPEALVAYVPRVIRGGREQNCEKGIVRLRYTSRMKFRVKHPGVISKQASIKWRAAAAARHPVKAMKWVVRKMGGHLDEKGEEALEKTEE